MTTKLLVHCCSSSGIRSFGWGLIPPSWLLSIGRLNVGSADAIDFVYCALADHALDQHLTTTTTKRGGRAAGTTIICQSQSASPPQDSLKPCRFLLGYLSFRRSFDVDCLYFPYSDCCVRRNQQNETSLSYSISIFTNEVFGRLLRALEP